LANGGVVENGFRGLSKANKSKAVWPVHFHTRISTEAEKIEEGRF